ncbi:META domain-containing protein [Tabrizicola fusiformis]|uniref:META domain-containing protein n=1 Tax=Tabrizicola sp. SY72 TaxID=2741673 RepID=UPI001571D324|nr:META domain-containing protein [Tabrizicola sp. SY72]NTT86319.1 META domain-containing protein [Tabrizicola sp. SY72]
MIRPIALALLLSLPAAAEAQQAIPPVLALEWTLAEVDGQPAGYTATLSVDAEGRLTGRAPCNRYFAGFTGTLPEFRPEAMGSTRMACDAMAEEDAYFTLLQGVDRLTHSERELHLSGAGHSLIFRRPLD